MEMKESADQQTLPFEPHAGDGGLPVDTAAVIPPRPKPEPPVRDRSNGLGGRILIAVCLLGAAYGLQSAVRRTAAEWLIRDGGAENLAWAVRLTPDNPLAWRRLARTQQDGTEALRRAAELLPNEAQAWVDLALELEAQGDLAGAESALDQAAAVDPGFLPRWSLANFHLRQGREEEFWGAIREAIRSDRSQTPMAAALCWRAFDDPDLILERAIPDDPASLQSFLYHLIGKGDINALEKVWRRYEPHVRAADVPVIADLLDDLVAAGEVDLALSMWNALIGRGLLEFQALDPVSGPFLTNADFGLRLTGLGFDWKTTPTPGILRSQPLRRGFDKTLEIELSGGQEEYTLLLEQTAPVPADAELILRFSYATRRLPVATGLVWTLRDPRSGRALARSEALEASEDNWSSGELRVRTQPGLRLLSVQLSYERARGVERYRGLVALRSVDLVRAADEERPR